MTGVVAPDRIWRNVGAQPGDALILTKPLGTGLFCKRCAARSLRTVVFDGRAAALRRRHGRDEPAGGGVQGFSVHAATDVTGFALVGHALGMTRATQPAVRLCIDLDRLPLYPGALALAAAGVTCGGAKITASPIAVSWRSTVRSTPRTKSCCLIRRPRAACWWRCRRTRALRLWLHFTRQGFRRKSSARSKSAATAPDRRARAETACSGPAGYFLRGRLSQTPGVRPRSGRAAKLPGGLPSLPRKSSRFPEGALLPVRVRRGIDALGPSSTKALRPATFVGVFGEV